MRTTTSALLPIFRSQLTADALGLLYLHPAQEFTLTGVAERVGSSLPTVHREMGRLVESGLVDDRVEGRNRLVRANGNHPAAEPLTRLLELSYGPIPVVGEEFQVIAGVRQVIIFGSWAARHSGIRGSFPHDVDVLVVGEGLKRADVYAAADRAQERLGLPVNPTLRTSEEWQTSADRLTSEIRTRPWIDVLGGGEADGGDVVEGSEHR